LHYSTRSVGYELCMYMNDSEYGFSGSANSTIRNQFVCDNNTPLPRWNSNDLEAAARYRNVSLMKVGYVLRPFFVINNFDEENHAYWWNKKERNIHFDKIKILNNNR
jgi:hypothetical protein